MSAIPLTPEPGLPGAAPSPAAAPVIAPYNPNAQNLNATLLGPSAHHLLGTDQLGRDVFTCLLYTSPSPRDRG